MRRIIAGLGKKETIQCVFAMAILSVWVASFIASLLSSHVTSVGIHTAFGVVSGWLFGQGVIKELMRKNGNGKN